MAHGAAQKVGAEALEFFYGVGGEAVDVGWAVFPGLQNRETWGTQMLRQNLRKARAKTTADPSIRFARDAQNFAQDDTSFIVIGTLN